MTPRVAEPADGTALRDPAKRARVLGGSLAVLAGAVLLAAGASTLSPAERDAGLRLASGEGLREVSLDSVLATITGRGASNGSDVVAGALGPARALTVPMTIDPLAPVTDPFARATPTTVAAVDLSGLPLQAMTAYRAAADRLAVERPGCGMTWSLLAAIGKVESHHGTIFGAGIGVDGRVLPAIIGLRLDGAGPVAEIRDTDGGWFDGDLSYDRAVGPMQFLPGTWRAHGRDGDGNGTADPHDLDDAALSAGTYLCAVSSVGDPSGAARAVFGYNRSQAYVDRVLALSAAYAGAPAPLLALAGPVLSGPVLSGPVASSTVVVPGPVLVPGPVVSVLPPRSATPVPTPPARVAPSPAPAVEAPPMAAEPVVAPTTDAFTGASTDPSPTRSEVPPPDEAPTADEAQARAGSTPEGPTP